MQRQKTFLYCHFFLDSAKGVIKTVKIPLENLNLHIIELKGAIVKILESMKDPNSTPFKIFAIKKTILSSNVSDTLRVSQFFENKDDIFCQVELNLQSVKLTTKDQGIDDVLKFKSLTTYSFWVASNTIVRVKVPLKGVQNLPKENIKSAFTESSLEVKVLNLNGVNYCFAVPRMDAKIIPEKCEVSTDQEGNIMIRLRKAKEDDHWSYLYKQKYVGEN
jgi:cellobiose phosphorylase